jgi:molybdopterin-guanine dinucleotide biosynthesis protein B
VGSSNSGKTELICRLLEWFSAQGLKVAVLKHSHHQRLGDDDKDTWRYRQTGARLVALAAPGLLQITRSSAEEPKLNAILAELAPGSDLILVEGYKTSDLPKVGLAPPDAASPLPDYPRLVAWVSARPLPTHLPVFNPLQVAAIGRFIQDQLGGR